ncbi:AlpA family phage regulatory protein [Noviherbaspirillum sp. 1P10PC]|uniref:helix-turn-helix transcriptional regulator n=1 Tax=Noviherbaspirillum sp. 1P10PC TaxID=3132292 RepID=UPI0039A3635E
MVQHTPPRKTLRIGASAKKLDIGVSTVWLKINTEPDFPRPFKLGPRTTVFFEDELDAYLERCAAKSRQADAQKIIAQSPHVIDLCVQAKPVPDPADSCATMPSFPEAPKR